MNLPTPTLLLGVFSAAAVFVVVAHDLERTSPGQLASVHQRVDELAAADGCVQCHGGWFESMSDSCLECHEAIAEHLDTGSGLHGALEPELARSCAKCHSDHHGEGFAIVDVQSFFHAGFENRDAFEHPRVGFDMAGEHLELGCIECHENADERFLPEGEHRYIGLDQNCASCHEDPHEGRMAMACADCHSQESFEEVQPFEHERFLALTGAHEALDCRTCHAEDDAHALESIGTKQQLAERACADCHESPHTESFITGVAGDLGATVTASCGECHVAAVVESFGMDDPELTLEQHAFTGFALAEPHGEVACADCHSFGTQVDREDFAARYPGRLPDDCAACHADAHEGQFESGAFAGRRCVDCHELTHFEPHAFSVSDHAQTAFDLTGTHAQTDCADCHSVPGGSEVRQFAATPGTCEDCHDDAHTGFFESALADREIELNACSECHLTTTFGDVDQDSFAHDEWTGFAISGAHAHSACESCHTRTEEPDEMGRSFGCVAKIFGAPNGCEACHADPHGGEFDSRPGTPHEINGNEGCARCHTESSFRAMRDDFDHQLWTGFPLVGTHFDLECAACHAPDSNNVGGAGHTDRNWGRARGQECSDCHSNPHAGQFRDSGTTDCSRCHNSPTSWDRLVFDHNRDSRFPLEDAHAALDCGACHEAWKPEDGTGPGIVRYRPLGVECADCHGHEEGGRR